MKEEPADCLGAVRHRGGVTLVKALVWNVGTCKKAGGNRKARWIPVIDKVMDALRLAHSRRTKNSPWVFTNPKMVGIYPNEPGR